MKATARQKAGWRMGAGLLACLLATVSAGCDELLDVDNPNELTQEALEKPVSANAVANGSLALVADAFSFVLLVHSTATDELKWVGSRDAWRELDFGNFSNPRNEFTDPAYLVVAQARWMADEAIRLLEGFDQAGTLPRKVDLGRAYLYAGVIYTYVADFFEDFTFSDRRTSKPPIGAANMSKVYDQAVQHLDKAVAVFAAAGAADFELAALAQRARTKHAKAVWAKTRRGAVATGTAGLVNDAGARADATAVLGKLKTADWMFRFAYSGATYDNDAGGWVNERLEHRVGDAYIVPDASDKKVKSIKLQDPIDKVPDPALTRIICEFSPCQTPPTPGSRAFGPLTVVSAREMHLILAEAALAGGDQTGFRTHINHVRELDKLTPYTGQIPALDMLKHARRVNLFLQGRRLVDHYRFADPADLWLADGEARRQPGTFFPITQIELESNECIAKGVC